MNNKRIKNLFLVIVFFLGLLSVSSQNEESYTLTIEVSVTKYNKGKILLALYDHPDHYMKKSIHSVSEKVVNHKAIIKFKNLKKGDYAYSLFHDINNNGKLDNNFFGVPKEPYGFSNKERGRFGPPKYHKVKFTIDKNTHQKISIK
ncbi:MAG: DUF2141 domain-containing protein [Flavobacteriaceae bacterium]